MLRRLLSRQSERAFTLLRVGSGLMFSVHGAQKLFGVLGGHVQPIGSQLWIGAVIELVTGLCIALGFQTACAAFLASGTMAVAYVQFHWKLRFDENIVPAVNQGEAALVYCLVFFFIACHGPGPLAFDRRSPS